MGGFRCASTGKNKKIIEISPLHFGMKGQRSENLKKSYLWSKMAFFKFYF
jgi:hypothetical protein